VVKANPYILAAAAIAGLTAVIVTAILKTKSYTEAQKEAAAVRQQTIAAAQQEDGVTKNLYDRLVGLEGIQGKTVAQKAEMSAVVDALNHRVSGLNLKYDEEKDKLDKTTKAIYEQITAMHAKALAAAYEKTLTQAYKEQAERQQKLADAKKNLLMYEQKLAEAQRTGADTETWRKRIKASEKSINDLTTGVKNGEKELKNLSSTVGSFKTFEQLTIQAKEAGIKIPRGLRDGVLSGKYEVPTSLGEIEALNNKKYANLVAKAKQSGIKIPKNIKDGLASGKMSVAEATSSPIDGCGLDKIEPAFAACICAAGTDTAIASTTLPATPSAFLIANFPASSIPRPRPSVKYLPISAVAFDGECSLKTFFNFFNSVEPNPFIFPIIQSILSCMPFHSPITRLPPAFLALPCRILFLILP